jgi:hypothetical protein
MRAIPSNEHTQRQHAPQGAARRWLALALSALGVQLILSACSIGTNDADLFLRFAGEIRNLGVIAVYGADPLFNHPPLVGLWIRAAAAIAAILPDPFGEAHAFCFVFKLPIIASHLISAWLVWRIWRTRVGAQRATAIGAAAAWSLCGILLSAYHCNTDPIYAMFCLAAVYCMEERRAFFVGGLLLGTAINVKILPVLLIPGLLLSCGSPRDAWRFIGGLAAGAIPFVPVLCHQPLGFVENALAYNSWINNWGVMVFLLGGRLMAGDVDSVSAAAQWYHGTGRNLLFALIAAWAIVARVRGRWTRYEIAAVTFAIFLIIAPGFGVQYLVILVPLMFAARPRQAILYSTAAGIFAGALYLAVHVTGSFPARSNVNRYPLPETLLGLVAWGVLVRFVATVWRATPSVLRPNEGSADRIERGPGRGELGIGGVDVEDVDAAGVDHEQDDVVVGGAVLVPDRLHDPGRRLRDLGLG